MTLFIGLCVIVAAGYAVFKRFDVRLVLLLAGLYLGAVAGQPYRILQAYLATFSNEQFVVPICSAMGFSYVLRLTECDKHLVQLLVRPLRRVRFLLIPGAVAVGFLVNVPIISQTSTAATVGAVLVPLLLAARVSRPTVGAALLLGSSIGGELLNPGAPELQTVSKALKVDPTQLVGHVLPLALVQACVAAAVFWGLSYFWERGAKPEDIEAAPPADADAPPFHINVFKALVPLLPLVILFLTATPLRLVIVNGKPELQALVQVPAEWLAGPEEKAARLPSRLIGLAMLVGAAVAACTSRTAWRDATKEFFAGAGYGFTHIVSLIVVATAFGEGVKLIGVAEGIRDLVRALPALLVPLAGVLPMAFAGLCGSGMASTQSLYGFFVEPARDHGQDPARLGAVVSLGAAVGRTASPVAAVTLMCASMTKTSPLTLAWRVLLPGLLGLLAVLLVVMLSP